MPAVLSAKILKNNIEPFMLYDKRYFVSEFCEKYTHFNKAQMNHHDSTMEHATFTFGIDGVSSVLLSHLTRHRFFSFSVTSERYSECIEDYITPPSIYDNTSAYPVYYQAIKSAYKAYKNLISLGIPMVDARFVLPKAN